jgi:hypothetical protein
MIDKILHPMDDCGCGCGENMDPESETDIDSDEDFLCDDEESCSELALVERAGMCSVTAEYVEMYQSAAVSMNAEDVSMNESASMLIIGDDVMMNNSGALLVIASDAQGEINTVFTPLTAAIFGGTLGLTIFLLGQIFRRPR